MKTLYKILLVLVLVCTFWFDTLSQTGTTASLGIGTRNPDTTAVLDISSSKKGMLVPRMTTTQRDAIAGTKAIGLTIFNTTTNCFEVWQGTEWDNYCNGRFKPLPYTAVCPVTMHGSLVKNTSASGAYVELSINVPGNFAAAAGIFDVKSNTVNGVTFFGTGLYFTSSQTQTINVYAKGTPTTEGSTTFQLVNNFTGETLCSFSYTVLSDKATIPPLNCATAGVVINDTLRVSEAAKASNTISVPISPTSTGPYNISTNTVNGIQYAGTGVITTTGNQTITLSASGTAVAAGTFTYTLTSNGVTPAVTLCSNLGIPVKAYNAQYTASCGSIGVFGTYTEGTAAASANNKVLFPVSITKAGNFSWTVQEVSGSSGLTFAAASPTGVYASTGSQTIVFMAGGTITAYGTKTFAITDIYGVQVCTFSVVITRGVGTFGNPSSSCLQILTQNPSATDGEYWVRNNIGDPVKTYCDMTNGGYTLVWSYSESTAFNIYPGAGMSMDNTYGLDVNKPIGEVTTQAGTINYSNYRASLANMKALKQNSTGASAYRIRITNNPTDMNDAWGVNNYLVASPSAPAFDYLIGTTSITCAPTDVPSKGKLFGYNYDATTATVTLNGVASAGPVCPIILGSSGYASHFATENRLSGNIVVNGYTVNANGFDNLFGVFAQTEMNHFFGKCGGSGGSETNFTIPTCSGTDASNGLYPHTSINSGQGRILQWFIK